MPYYIASINGWKADVGIKLTQRMVANACSGKHWRMATDGSGCRWLWCKTSNGTYKGRLCEDEYFGVFTYKFHTKKLRGTWSGSWGQ